MGDKTEDPENVLKHTIELEHADPEEMADIVASIKRTTKSAWVAALSSRGLKMAQLDDANFEMWWRDRLEEAKEKLE